MSNFTYDGHALEERWERCVIDSFINIRDKHILRYELVYNNVNYYFIQQRE